MRLAPARVEARSPGPRQSTSRWWCLLLLEPLRRELEHPTILGNGPHDVVRRPRGELRLHLERHLGPDQPTEMGDDLIGDAAAALDRLREQMLAGRWMIEARTGRHICPAGVAAYEDDWPAQLADREARQADKLAQRERVAQARGRPPVAPGVDPNWRRPPGTRR